MRKANLSIALRKLHQRPPGAIFFGGLVRYGATSSI